jgi:hypothetical protein
MSRRILSALLALILVATFATVSKADVTGSFEIDIELIPMGNQTEAVKFFIDFQSNLVINILLSGLTFGVDIGFGVTGVEFAVLSLRTSLGALSVDDLFVFAAPFGCAPHPVINDGNGNCPGITVIPVGDENGDGVVDNGVGFVKKRIGLQLTIAGISLENLAIFEDVDFPDINSDDTHSHDHFGPLEARGGTYNISDVNSVVSDATPTFGFGDVITISGETVSGITVTGSTAICAGRTNTIKKKSWTNEVNKACTSTLDNNITEIEGGAKTPLLFESETLSLGNIEIGGVTFTLSTTFKPGSPLAASGTASFNVLNLADVVVSFSSTNITNLTLSKIVATILADNLTIVVTDTNGDLVIDQTDATLNVTLNPNANAAALTIKVTTKAGTGLTALSLSLSITRTILTFSSTTVFGSSATVGTLAWSSTSFSLSVAPVADNLSFKFTTKYTPSGMGATKIELNVGF